MDDDREYISAVKEAATWASGRSLRKLFVSMLLCGSLKQPAVVWKDISSFLADDLYYINRHEVARSGNIDLSFHHTILCLKTFLNSLTLFDRCFYRPSNERKCCIKGN